MYKNEKGFGAVEALLIIVIIGLLCIVCWMVYSKQKDSKLSSKTANVRSQQTDKKQETTNNKEYAKQKSEINSKRTTITPFLGTKSFTVYLPDGWERNTRISEVSPVYSKSVGDVSYVISFVNGEVNTLQTDNPGYSTEGFLNQHGYTNTTIKSVITAKGTKIYIVKSINQLSGGGVLLLSSSQPNPTNSYIKYEGQNLGINIQVDGKQSTAEIDFTAPGINTIISDFESMASSLDL